MRNNKYILLAVIVLAVIAAILLVTRSSSTFSRELSDFAIDDTASVTMIYMSDKNNNSVKITRLARGQWQVNDRYTAQKINVEGLLKTMMSLEVSQPVALSAQDNIIRQMSVTSVKVEIYQKVYRIRLFNFVSWFPHEKRTRVFYVGGATMNNLGTYMLMEGSSRPFVVVVPGFRGFVSPRFSAMEKNWRDYTVFKKTIPEIAGVKIEFPANPELSYEFRNNGHNFFRFFSLSDQTEIAVYDTLKALNFLSGFRNLNFEALLNEMDKHRKDSIIASQPFIIISLTDTSGQCRTIKTFHKQGPPGQTDPLGRPLPYDLDRLYALVNEGQDFTLIQFFTFDKILRPKSFFIKDPGAN